MLSFQSCFTIGADEATAHNQQSKGQVDATLKNKGWVEGQAIDRVNGVCRIPKTRTQNKDVLLSVALAR